MNFAPQNLKFKRQTILFLTGLVVTAWCLWFAIGAKPQHAGPPAPKSVPQAGQTNQSTPVDLEGIIPSLAGVARPQDSIAALASLRLYLSSLPPEIASAKIREFLDSGRDVPTRLGFKLGPNGLLAEAPSLRVFLLDYLAQVDRSAAGKYAETILANANSPDEWAVALRNYAWANPSAETTDYLRQKVGQLILDQSWQKTPSVGYLEAFDVVVYSHDTSLVPALADLVRQTDNRAVTQAAYLTLDRLVMQDPTAVLAQLLQNPDSMNGRETTRADYFARSDVRDPQQKSLLESYLLNPQITATEITAFAQIYPNANVMVSDNLLTQTQVPSGDELASRDRQAFETVGAWLTDPRFDQLRPQLETIRGRLAQFISPPGISSR